MSAPPVLSVTSLSKKYALHLRRALWYGVRDIGRELMPLASREAALRPGEFWAVDDVSFQVERGASLAVVGGNGAGKSTLLKVLYGLLKPDRGEVRVRGRVEALIELGTGFNPLLSGRENIFIGAALHGLDRRGSAALLERVIDFADLGEFIDAPLQSYSSGMKTRLAYALSANLNPDILLVDEVLAVGDVAFQRKCAQHMRSYLDGGGSLLLVSHNTWHIQSVCERGILLDRGRIAFAGTAVETLSAMLERRAQPAAGTAGRAPAIGPVSVESLGAAAVHDDVCRTNEPVQVTLRYRAEAAVKVVWGFSIWTADQWVCVAGEHDLRPRTIDGEGELTCVIPRLPLVAGSYALRAGIVDAATLQPLALFGWHDAPATLEVRADADLAANAAATLNQLVRIDVDWR